MMTLHLTLEMTIVQVVETSITSNSLSKDNPHPDDHARQTTDTPGFKPFNYQFRFVVKTNYMQLSVVCTDNK